MNEDMMEMDELGLSHLADPGGIPLVKSYKYVVRKEGSNSSVLFPFVKSFTFPEAPCQA
jgi:hypothetical protein